jgi:hypothetical protein
VQSSGAEPGVMVIDMSDSDGTGSVPARSFGAATADHDRYRPRYPDRLVDDVVAMGPGRAGTRDRRRGPKRWRDRAVLETRTTTPTRGSRTRSWPRTTAAASRSVRFTRPCTSITLLPARHHWPRSLPVHAVQSGGVTSGAQPGALELQMFCLGKSGPISLTMPCTPVGPHRHVAVAAGLAALLRHLLAHRAEWWIETVPCAGWLRCRPAPLVCPCPRTGSTSARAAAVMTPCR